MLRGQWPFIEARRGSAGQHARTVRPWLQLVFSVGLCFAGETAWSEESAKSEEPTPEAGQEFRTRLFGEDIYVPPRDRRNVTAASFGIQWIPNGPPQLEVLPFGALYFWRNWDSDNRRFRGAFSIVVNDLDYTIGLRTYPNWSLIFTLDNFILPLGRFEYVEGQ